MWADSINEFRSVIYKKVTKPPCEIEIWATTGEIDAGMDLYLVNIPFDEFLFHF